MSILLWLSALLLAGFLIYWNVDSYQRKKADLIREMEYQAQLASSQINDSLLYTIIRVMHTDSTGDISTISEEINGHIKMDVNFKQEINTMKGDSLVYSFVESSMDIDSVQELFIFGGDESLFDSVHSDGFHARLDDTISSVTSVRVLKAFRDNLESENLPSIFYTSKNNDSLSGRAIAINFDFDPLEKVRTSAIFGNYGSFLWKKSIPNILFSSLLFMAVLGSLIIINRSRKVQQRLNIMKGEFVSNMTHELKTPLTTVGVALEAMSDFNVLDNKEKTNEYLDISKHELKRLNMLVDKVLKMSMFEKGNSVLKLEPLDIKNILDDIIASMALYFERKNVTLDFEVVGQDFDVQGDRVHLTNVCYNLIDNAIKYSRQNLQLKIKLEQKRDQILLSFADNGIGIPKEYVGKIFDRFFRVPTKDRHDVKGHGLGLSYVAQIIDKHQGSISLDSKKGTGSTFYLTFPKSSSHG